MEKARARHSVVLAGKEYVRLELRLEVRLGVNEMTRFKQDRVCNFRPMPRLLKSTPLHLLAHSPPHSITSSSQTCSHTDRVATATQQCLHLTKTGPTLSIEHRSLLAMAASRATELMFQRYRLHHLSRTMTRRHRQSLRRRTLPHHPCSSPRPS